MEKKAIKLQEGQKLTVTKDNRVILEDRSQNAKKLWESVDEFLGEDNLQSVFEMATLRQRRDRLPLNVKLDCAKKYASSRHGKRLEVQNSTNPKFIGDWFCIAIEATEKDEQGNERPKVIGNVSKQAKDHLETMLRFVEMNRSSLSKLADMEMSFDEFLEVMQIP